VREKLHPAYKMIKVSCTCGNEWYTRSTSGRDIKLEICSACHPFFTGKQKLIDSVGSLSRFQRRYKKTEGKTIRRKPKVKKVVKKASLKTKKIPKKKKSPPPEEDEE